MNHTYLNIFLQYSVGIRPKVHLLLAQPTHPLPQPSYVVHPVLTGRLAREDELGLWKLLHQRWEEKEPRGVAESIALLYRFVQRQITLEGAGLEGGDRGHVERRILAAQLTPGRLACAVTKKSQCLV